MVLRRALHRPAANPSKLFSCKIRTRTVELPGQKDYPMSGSRLHMGAVLLLLFAAVSGCAPASKTIELPVAHAAAPIDQMPRILIPAGRFVMGNADDKGEMPAHAVELSSFLIDRTEVTNGQ